MSNNKEITITLTGYEWARLLSRLEEDMQICNINQSITIELWEKIATQLNGEPVHVIHADNPDPKYRPVKAEPVAPKPIASGPTARPSMLRWFSSWTSKK